MKFYGMAAVCPLILIGCATENELRFTATLDAETSGLVLSEDGLDAQGGMSGTTCQIDTAWGCPVADADLPTTWERVLDSYDGTTLGASDLGLHTIVGGVWVQERDEALPEVRAARLYKGGKVVVLGHEGACTVQRDGAAIAVPNELCEDRVRFSVDRDSGVVVATSAKGAWRVEATGASAMTGVGDLTAWDASLGLLFTATKGDATLSAIDPDGGAVAWTVETGGPISDVVTRGKRDEVLVRIGGSTLPVLERREGRTGELLGSSTLPEDDGELVVSDDGTTIAVVLPQEVNFYDLLTDGEMPREDRTPPSCITPTMNGNSVNLGD